MREEFTGINRLSVIILIAVHHEDAAMYFADMLSRGNIVDRYAQTPFGKRYHDYAG